MVKSTKIVSIFTPKSLITLNSTMGTYLTLNRSGWPTSTSALRTWSRRAARSPPTNTRPCGSQTPRPLSAWSAPSHSSTFSIEGWATIDKIDSSLESVPNQQDHCVCTTDKVYFVSIRFVSPVKIVNLIVPH